MKLISKLKMIKCPLYWCHALLKKTNTLNFRFKFFVDHESQYYALSNGAQESREPIRSGWVRTTFERTPEMSTYITAMIITNYRYYTNYSTTTTTTSMYLDRI